MVAVTAVTAVAAVAAMAAMAAMPSVVGMPSVTGVVGVVGVTAVTAMTSVVGMTGVTGMTSVFLARLLGTDGAVVFMAGVLRFRTHVILSHNTPWGYLVMPRATNDLSTPFPRTMEI